MPQNTIDRVFNCVSSHKQEEDYTLKTFLGDTRNIRSLLKLPIVVELLKARESVDLTEDAAHWWKINNQGGTGSCVGWAIADSVVRWHLIKAGKLDSGTLLSARYVWMAAKELDADHKYPTSFIEHAGTSLRTGLDVVRKYGIVADDILPFGKHELYPKKPAEFYAEAGKLKIGAFYYLGSTIPAVWRYWISAQGPIAARLLLDAHWDRAQNAKNPKKDSRFLKYEQHKNNRKRGHAVALVGYDKDGFKIRNSWGKKWGDQGYAYASDEYLVKALKEAYGITLKKPASPPKPPPGHPRDR